MEIWKESEISRERELANLTRQLMILSVSKQADYQRQLTLLGCWRLLPISFLSFLFCWWVIVCTKDVAAPDPWVKVSFQTSYVDFFVIRRGHGFKIVRSLDLLSSLCHASVIHVTCTFCFFFKLVYTQLTNKHFPLQPTKACRGLMFPIDMFPID